MVNEIFPEKTDAELTDKEWENLCCNIWCIAELNKCANMLRNIESLPLRHCARMIDRAIEVIDFLVKEREENG